MRGAVYVAPRITDQPTGNKMTITDWIIGGSCAVLILLGLTLIACDLGDRLCDWINDQEEN